MKMDLPASVTNSVSLYWLAQSPISTLPRIAVTGAIRLSAAMISGRPMSPP
jgi:hypothetical protein